MTTANSKTILILWLGIANREATTAEKERTMNLLEGTTGQEYIIKEILTDDEELNAFLFSLGCYSGEPITMVSRRKGSCVVSIKDGRYNIDDALAEAIII